jgi:hypothetical protein
MTSGTIQIAELQDCRMAGLQKVIAEGDCNSAILQFVSV